MYIYIHIYRKFSPVVRLGGLAPARPISTVHIIIACTLSNNVLDIILIHTYIAAKNLKLMPNYIIYSLRFAACILYTCTA